MKRCCKVSAGPSGPSQTLAQCRQPIFHPDVRCFSPHTGGVEKAIYSRIWSSLNLNGLYVMVYKVNRPCNYFSFNNQSQINKMNLLD